MTGGREGFLLLAMQRNLLVMKEKVNSMLYWVLLGIGLSMGFVGLEAGLLGKLKAGPIDGPSSLMGSHTCEMIKHEKKVNELGSSKSSQLRPGLFRVIRNWLLYFGVNTCFIVDWVGIDSITGD